MEIGCDYEAEHELQCPFCGRKAKHAIRDTIYVDVEPPDRDGPDL